MTRAVRPAARGALCAVALGLVACGSGDGGEPDLPAGFWYPATEVSGAAARPLDGLGYADGFERAGDAGATGAFTLDASRVAPGLNLYTSGHAAEAFLVTSEGEVAHTWRLPHDRIPGAPPLDHPTQVGWRRARLLADGSLLALHDGIMLVKVSRDSELVWWFGDRAHHDLDVAPDGTIAALTRRVADVPRITERAPVLDESVTFLSAGGDELRSISILDALEGSPWADEVRAAAADPGRPRIEIDGRGALDLLHANSVRVLDGRLADRDPAFAAGHVLLCLRELNVICVLDPEASEIVWLRTGPWVAPHDPRLTDAGTLTIFDNRGAPGGGARVLEIDPLGGDVLWSFPGAASPATLTSPVCGAARRLATGSTLVTESTRGRAVEVAPDGDVVWAFVSPHRVGEAAEFVAVLFEVERVPHASVAGWRDAMNGEVRWPR